MKRSYIVYKITNKFDGKFYVGCHSTLNTNDRYMGSGIEIREAIKKFGRKSFIKETLDTFDTKEEMFSKEKEIVTKEFCMRDDTYNRIEGGGTYLTEGMIVVKDVNNKKTIVYKDDPRYLSGELKANNCGLSFKKGIVAVRDKEGNNWRVDKNDPRYISGEFISIFKDTVTVKDKNGSTSRVSCDNPEYISGELVPIAVGKVVVKDNDGNLSRVNKDDPRYVSGELVHFHKGKKGKSGMEGKKHTINTIKKMSDVKIGNKHGLGKKHPYSEEQKQAIRKNRCREFFVYKDDKFVSKELSINDFAKQNGLSHGNMSGVLNGKAKQTKGFKFFYEFKGDKL